MRRVRLAWPPYRPGDRRWSPTVPAALGMGTFREEAWNCFYLEEKNRVEGPTSPQVQGVPHPRPLGEGNSEMQITSEGSVRYCPCRRGSKGDYSSKK